MQVGDCLFSLSFSKPIFHQGSLIPIEIIGLEIMDGDGIEVGLGIVCVISIH